MAAISKSISPQGYDWSRSEFCKVTSANYFQFQGIIETNIFCTRTWWRLFCIIYPARVLKFSLTPGWTSCRIWSWSPVPCKKTWLEGLLRPRFLSLMRPEGHGFHTARETMINPIIACSLIDFSMFNSHEYEFKCFKMGTFWLTSWMLGKSHRCYGLVAKGHKRIIVMETCILTLLNEIVFSWIKILIAMENFEKCTVAMLGGPCSQHVTCNTSRLYQPQSAIIFNKPSSCRRFETLHGSHCPGCHFVPIRNCYPSYNIFWNWFASHYLSPLPL